MSSTSAFSGNPSFSISAAQLVGNFCESIFFGIYLVTCIFCARTLFLKGSGPEERWVHLHEIRWLMLTAALSLLFICTFDVAIGLLHNFHAFIESTDSEEEFGRLSDWINIARSVNNLVAMIVWDLVLIYRCWVVHGHRWLIMIPSIILYLGSIAVGCGLVVFADILKPKGIQNQAANATLPIAFFGFSFLQNIFTTSVLIWRIWRVERESERYRLQSGSTVHQPRRLRKVIRVIAESGAAYTIMVFITLMCTALTTNVIYPVSDMTIQVAGIAFNAILVRSSPNRDQRFFGQNERPVVPERPMSARSSLGSLRFAPNTHGVQYDTERTIHSANDQDKHVETILGSDGP